MKNLSFEDLNVMIVEDDLILTLSLELMLKRHGFRTFFRAETGERALEISAESVPDLLLVDIYLGEGISGVQAVKQIQKEKRIPVIYITGNSDDHNRELATETDFVEYLIKPVTPGDIRRCIGKIWPESITTDSNTPK
ncbi:MAG: response regulator [Balneolaceae bacterium]